MDSTMAMGSRLERFVERLNAMVDWFVPASMTQSPEKLQAVRMFLFSHLFGPILGHTVTLSMLALQGQADTAWWVLFASVTAFWPLAFILRYTGWYVALSLLSIQNLIFCILWACYLYGGISSPNMPWMVAIPLLAFFYLPWRSTRIIVSLQIVVNLGVFYGLYAVYGVRETATSDGLVVLGLISTFCASAYVSMMALYFANIVYSQGELEREIVQHLATEQRLRQATSQAQRALAAKSDFLAKLTHELKNPLNAAIGYSELLIENSDDSNPQRLEDMHGIRRAGHRLLVLIDNLLELSRLEAGKADLRVEDVDLAGCIERAVFASRPLIEAGGNALVLHNVAGETITCDRQRLERIVEGLLSNAARFTQNGRITVSVSMQGRDWSVSIEDTGVGIGPERIETLFDTIGTSGAETSSKYDDKVRLGLPLAYRYCRLMGGTLVVESEPGRGCRAVVRLPRRSPGAHSSVGIDSEALESVA
ncbi:MAG: HAMP domain-containing histidine kinase [Acidobacteria bacterium]|nr:HAMP domain-containing histidine kinase [Acidobacteriota bacterium]